MFAGTVKHRNRPEIARHKFDGPAGGRAFRLLQSTAGSRTEAPDVDHKQMPLRRRRSLKRILPIIVVLIVAGCELQTSTLQALVFSSYATTVSFDIAPGQSPQIAFPTSGPFDRRRGYTEIPRFVDRLSSAGYEITEQVRASSQLLSLLNWGINPPYDEGEAKGLQILAQDGSLLYQSRLGDHQFRSIDEIPVILLKSLLFIENRELELDASSTVNPVIEWDRFGWAGLAFTGRSVGLSLPVEGGSTLAVQLEKYRHSPNGRTTSAADKVRQILGASLRVYRSGSDTQEERRKIVLEYLNTMPLAAQVGYGEVHGIGEGLHAWFGWDLQTARDLLSSDSIDDQAAAVKRLLALLCAVRAPSVYLVANRDALEDRIANYTDLLEQAGILNSAVAQRVSTSKLVFLERAPSRRPPPYLERKHIDSTRAYLQQLLGTGGLYELDRLHLNVQTPIDAKLQNEIRKLLANLRDWNFVTRHGLRSDRLLGSGDPRDVVYSVTLFERSPYGNLLRAQADSLDKPFDLNTGMKMELGSTAKLRTLAHYLELVAELYSELIGVSPEQLSLRSAMVKDPISTWGVQTLQQHIGISLESFLELALERKYSTGTGEVFFTGGGAHTFSNFDDADGGQSLTLRDAFRRSNNLVFIRLMRDLVRFHQARLPYDVWAVLNDLENPVRMQLLQEAADAESRLILARTFRRFRALTEEEVVRTLLGPRSRSIRHLSILFFAWNPGGHADDLRRWLEPWTGEISVEEASRLLGSYDPARLNLLDYAYLLDKHPLEIWCAGEMLRDKETTWHRVLTDSGDARRAVSRWLFKAKNRRAQDLRLRIRVEQDAFDRMTPYWQNLGFPFEKLIPSLATAIGSSSDRPIALAELVGIILNEGARLPMTRVTGLRVAAGTPYETALEPIAPRRGEVMHPAVARTLRQVLASVVESGTAQRLAGAFVRPDGTPIVAGGKTGSGDNRHAKVSNRTATFVFYVGDRYFGVITAHVDGPAANRHHFTSALPVTILKMLAPSLNPRLEQLSTPQIDSIARVATRR